MKVNWSTSALCSHEEAIEVDSLPDCTAMVGQRKWTEKAFKCLPNTLWH